YPGFNVETDSGFSVNSPQEYIPQTEEPISETLYFGGPSSEINPRMQHMQGSLV
ncbi:hypothetical protein DFQ28_001450, partial [Apophysomyces sp. BC1034]